MPWCAALQKRERCSSHGRWPRYPRESPLGRTRIPLQRPCRERLLRNRECAPADPPRFEAAFPWEALRKSSRAALAQLSAGFPLKKAARTAKRPRLPAAFPRSLRPIGLLVVRLAEYPRPIGRASPKRKPATTLADTRRLEQNACALPRHPHVGAGTRVCF